MLARMKADGLLEDEDITPTHGGKTTRIYRGVKKPYSRLRCDHHARSYQTDAPNHGLARLNLLQTATENAPSS